MFRVERWAVPALAVGLSLSVFFLWVGAQGYPTYMGVDAFCYLNPAISFEQGDGLVAHACRYTASCDPSHQDRLLAYPPGFPIVLSLLMPQSNMKGALLAVQILQAIGVIMGGLAASRVLERISPQQLSVWKGALLLLVVLALSSGFGAMGVGRPEVLVQAMIAFGVLVLCECPDRIRSVIAGVLIGLLASISPWGGVTGGLVFAWWRSLQERELGPAIRQVVSAGLVSLLAFFCLVPFFPGRLSEMVEAAGCVKVAFSDYVAQAPARSFSWKYFLFFRPGGLGHPLVVGVAAALSIGILSIAGQSRAMRIVGVATRLFIAALSSWIVFEYAYYVVAPWLPLALIVVARFVLLVLQDGSRSERGAMAWSVALGLSAVLALPSVGVAQSLLGWVGFRGGVSWDAADAAVGRVMNVLGDRPIGLDRTLALLPRESERAIAFTNENGRVRYHSRDGQIREIDGDAPPAALIRGYCEPVRVDGYSTVCLPWREPGPALQRWVDYDRYGWAFTLLIRDDAAIDVDALVNDMMCAAGDAAKPGSCRPR